MTELGSMIFSLVCTIILCVMYVLEGRSRRYWQDRCETYEQLCDNQLGEVLTIKDELAKWKAHAEPFATVWQGVDKPPAKVPILADVEPPLYVRQFPPYFSD